MSQILTLNAGSSSIKFSVYSAQAAPVELAVGLLERLGSSEAELMLKHDGQKQKTRIGQADHATGLQAILQALAPVLDGEVVGVGHRIVHGGTEHDAPVVLSEAMLASLEKFVPLAPLHQPHNLSAVRAAMATFPNAVQVGCFDTAFHRGHPWVNDTFALPRKYYEAGVRRYGFHGLSYDYITGELARIDPVAAKGRSIVAHLGNGASMCAILNGQSIGSTMGFSALDGLPMGTRCGSVDPGVLLYLLDQEGMSTRELSDLLYKNSGLKGMSGLSNDMRELQAAGTEAAAQAIDYYVFRIRREIGAMAAILGGVDTVVFCGGIGENSASIRGRICEGMEWIGIELDADDNEANAPIISCSDVTVRVIRTDEEVVIARAVQEALNFSAQSRIA